MFRRIGRPGGPLKPFFLDRRLAVWGPVPLHSLAQDRGKLMTLRRIHQMEKMALLNRATFTPTDALHVLGKMSTWNSRASQLGARILARLLGINEIAFCKAVIRSVSRRLAKELFGKALASRSGSDKWDKELASIAFLDLAFNGLPHDELECRVKFKKPLVAIGAPVATYMPEVAAALNTRLGSPTMRLWPMLLALPPPVLSKENGPLSA